MGGLRGRALRFREVGKGIVVGFFGIRWTGIRPVSSLNDITRTRRDRELICGREWRCRGNAFQGKMLPAVTGFGMFPGRGFQRSKRGVSG